MAWRGGRDKRQHQVAVRRSSRLAALSAIDNGADSDSDAPPSGEASEVEVTWFVDRVPARAEAPAPEANPVATTRDSESGATKKSSKKDCSSFRVVSGGAKAAYACKGCGFASKWTKLLSHLREYPHHDADSSARVAANYRVDGGAAGDAARNGRLAESAARRREADALDALAATLDGGGGPVAPPAKAPASARRRARSPSPDDAAAAPLRANDAIYGRGAALLRRMGWKDGEGAGKRRTGLDAAAIVSACVPSRPPGLGIGAAPPPPRPPASAAEKRAKKRRKAARAAGAAAPPWVFIDRRQDPAPPLDASQLALARATGRAPPPPPPDGDRPAAGRGRGRVLPAWMAADGGLPS